MRLAVSLALLTAVCAAAAAGRDLVLETPDGKQVVLQADGTWHYLEKRAPGRDAGEERVKPVAATERHTSRRKFVELWYDPLKWSPTLGISEDAEISLVHSEGDGYALLIVERIPIPYESLRKIAIENARAMAPDAEVVLEERRIVNGAEMAVMRVDGTAEGVVFSYYGHYWAGDAGAVQLVAFTAKSLFDEYAADFSDLLDGLVITKP